MIDFSRKDIMATLELDAGRKIVLFDCSGTFTKNEEEDRSRNIFLYDENGEIIWRVYSEHDQDGIPYTNIYRIK